MSIFSILLKKKETKKKKKKKQEKNKKKKHIRDRKYNDIISRSTMLACLLCLLTRCHHSSSYIAQCSNSNSPD